MCGPEAKFHKQIIHQQDLTGTAGTFVKRIDVPFTPKWMSARVAYYGDGTENSTAVLRLVGIGKIGVFADGSDLTHALKFKMTGDMSGEYRFEVLSSTDAVDATRNGVLVVALEFMA